MAELNWTDAQWQNVNAAVTNAFREASVANAFLPMYGPLVGSAEIVRNERLVQQLVVPPTIRLDADHDAVNLKLVNLTVNVELSSEQVADETLSNALLAFRRAANILALQEDLIVFSGYGRGYTRENSAFVANQIAPQKGLADLPARNRRFEAVRAAPPAVTVGQAVVTQVVEAIGRLETASNPSPFACVLGNELFNRVHDPQPNSLVLASDRITPLLKGGPLLRSGMMDTNSGIVVSLAGNAVDLVVGTPPTTQFLQRQPNARFLFRLYERFVLRIRDDINPPVDGFRIRPAQDEIAAEADLIRLLGF
jgi:uncharacterized linocin/CFP29 family protein